MGRNQLLAIAAFLVPGVLLHRDGKRLTRRKRGLGLTACHPGEAEAKQGNANFHMIIYLHWRFCTGYYFSGQLDFIRGFGCCCWYYSRNKGLRDLIQLSNKGDCRETTHYYLDLPGLATIDFGSGGGGT